MDIVSRLTDTLATLPDPLIYTLIAFGASGAVYSTFQHVKAWRPRNAKRVKLKGADGRKIENSLTSASLGVLARSTNYNVAFAAKKILVERALADPCRKTLFTRLESSNLTTRLEALITLKYIFDFKHKTRSLPIEGSRLMIDLPDNKAMLQILSFGIFQYRTLFTSLKNSIDSPEATKLVIQNITWLMKMNKPFRIAFRDGNILFREWIEDLRNPLYQLHTVEGLLVCSTDEYAEDIFLPEVQQFIYYIGESAWPLPSNLSPRVIERFKRIWRVEAGQTPVLPFPDPGERWFSDRESERSDEEDDYYETYTEFLNSMENPGTDDGEGSVDFIDDEPETLTPEDIMRYFHVAEEAGLRSQDRRRGGRRAIVEQPVMQL